MSPSKSNKTARRTFEERQAKIADLVKLCDALREHLDCAECSETAEGLDANLDEAEGTIETLSAELKEVRE